MSDGWERQALQDLLTASLKEQRSARRWGVFFKLATLAYLSVVLLLALGVLGGAAGENITSEPHTAVVRLQGVIAAGSDGADAESLQQGLREAFADPNTKAVLLQANSPGGSPVQSAVLYDEIQRLRKLHPKVPLYVVMEDVCASGCYYVAAAAERIYASRASIVGSIGVRMDGFGFTGTMDKLGVERRLITAGENKGFLDPFSPENPQQRAKAQELIGEVHQQFIDAVKQGRGKRLQNDPELFSGLVWSGDRSRKLGLIDDFGSVSSVAREVVKVENLVDFTPRATLADRLARQIGAAAAQELGARTQLQLQ